MCQKNRQYCLIGGHFDSLPDGAVDVENDQEEHHS